MSEVKSALPIVALIEARSRELGLRPIELVRRAGYKNTARGLRHLNNLREGHLGGNFGLLQGLPAALQLPHEVVRLAVAETQRQLKEAEETAWRAAFKAHGVVITERLIPQPIFVAAFIGVNNLLRIDFDLAAGPGTFAVQAGDGLRKKLARWNGKIPTFGRATAFLVNYTPDWAVEYDLDGSPTRVLDHARRLGTISFDIGGRILTDAQMAAIFPGAKLASLRNG